MVLTAAHLRPVIQTHGEMLDLALSMLFSDPDAPISLDGLRPLATGARDLADVLASVLETAGKSDLLALFFAGRGISLTPQPDDGPWDTDIPPLPGAAIPVPVPNDFPLDLVGPFALRASAFRCRIEVDNTVEGSGAFISKRLVLTAAHVIDKLIAAQQDAAAQGINDPVLPRITVRTSDGRRFPARCVWYSPVHADERNGTAPPDSEAAKHKDTALLRVGLPLGLSYGYCELPEKPVDWIGARLMTLVHYPDGARRGLTRGRVLRETADDLRLRHDVNTDGGSSGGLAFDRDLKFIGIHQGRWNAFRKLVPHGVFSTAPGFVDAMARDAPRRFLWSLEDDINGQLVVGRQQFFAGLAAMLEQPQTRLRGIWVRRLDPGQTTGLSFSFEMLKAFLTNRLRPGDPPTQHRTFKIPTDLEIKDLIGEVAQLVLETDAAEARAGVRLGETSDTAAARDRAMALADLLQQRAAEQGTTYWLFFEAPPDGKLSDVARTQFEHLAEWLVTHPNLRLILAGFEQYALAPLRFQHVEEGETKRLPGLLVDMLGDFTDTDVRVTLTAMMADLAGDDNVAPDQMNRMVEQVTLGMAEVKPGVYPMTEIGRAVDRIRAAIRLAAGL